MRKGIEDLKQKIKERTENFVKREAENIWNDMIESLEIIVDTLSDEEVARMEKISIFYKVDSSGKISRTGEFIILLEAKVENLIKATYDEEQFIGNIFENTEVMKHFFQWIDDNENLNSNHEFYSLRTNYEFELTLEVRE